MAKWLTIFAFFFFWVFDSSGQNLNLDRLVSLNYTHTPLEIILKKLEEKHQLKFSYSSSLLPLKKKLSLRIQKESLRTALNKLFNPINIKYALIGNQVVLKKNTSTRNYISFDEKTPTSPEPPPFIINILDASTSTPVSQVHIFRNDSILIGTSTIKGTFRLSSQYNHEIKLAFSHVSYESVKQTINPATQKQHVLWMIPKIEKLKGVTISINRDKRWKKLFNKFKTDFLGTSSNADQCKILNPWVVEFLKTSQGIKLKGSSEDTLEIENYALGYKLLFLLNQFDLANDDVYYKGQCWFSSLTAKNKKQNKRWVRNRRRAYKGSFQHFLAALANNQINQEGFDIMVSKYPPYKSNGFYFTVPLKQLLRPGKKPNEFLLISPYYIKIVYYNELEEFNYLRWYKRSNPWLTGQLKPHAQFSWLWLGSGAIAFDNKGRILNDADKVIRYGYWAWERVAEMLPNNYLSKAYLKLGQKNKR